MVLLYLQLHPLLALVCLQLHPLLALVCLQLQFHPHLPHHLQHTHQLRVYPQPHLLPSLANQGPKFHLCQPVVNQHQAVQGLQKYLLVHLVWVTC